MDGKTTFFAIALVLAYLWPIVAVLNSPHLRGTQKNRWLIATVLLSWFAYLLYLIALPEKAKPLDKPVPTSRTVPPDVTSDEDE